MTEPVLKAPAIGSSALTCDCRFRFAV